MKTENNVKAPKGENIEQLERELAKNSVENAQVQYRVTYTDQFKNFHTYLVGTLKECLNIWRRAKEKGYNPTRHKVTRTIDLHTIEKPF